MARHKSKPVESGYGLFDVLYEDGSRISNRRVPRCILGGLDGDGPARKALRSRTTLSLRKLVACAFRSRRFRAHKLSLS